MNTNLNISNSEYDDLISKKAQKSPILKNIFFAFVIGGIICMIGQFINDTLQHYGISKEHAACLQASL